MSNLKQKTSSIILWTLSFIFVSFIMKQTEIGTNDYELNNCNRNLNQPNVLFIVADDLGYGDVNSFYNQGRIPTPQLNKLASQGVKLTNYHAGPVCSQSRAAVLTGTFTNGYSTNVDMIAQHFKNAGYQTGAFGKWHNGNESGVHPIDRGFDEFIGFIAGGRAYRSEYSTAGIFNGKTPYTVNDWSHTTDLFADKAIDFIEKNKDQPFFGWVAFNAVHAPFWTPTDPKFQGRQDWIDKVTADGITDNGEKDYNALVQHMDSRIGDIIDRLDTLGLSENTLVVFLSDNGALTPLFHYGPSTQDSIWKGSNAIYRAGKSSVYEGGTRVPCIMRWTGKIPENLTSDANITNFDLYPTFRELLGDPTTLNTNERLRGKSILDFLTNGGIDTRANVPYAVGFGGNRCLNYGDWKYVSHPNAVPDRETIYGEPANSEAQLYNLKEDPQEANNVALDYPEKVNQMKYILSQMLLGDLEVPNTIVAGDLDCIPNDQDEDSDNDGIPDRVEGLVVDTDMDGVPNFLDLDSDNDCILDSQEGVLDNNRNGIANYIDPDISQDCYLQLGLGFINNPDVDGDGTLNIIEENDPCKDPINPADLDLDFEAINNTFTYNIEAQPELKDDYLELTAVNTPTFYMRRDGLSMDAQKVNTITAKIRSTVAGPVRLYWLTEQRTAFRGNFVELNYITPNQWQELEFNVGDNLNWNNQIIKTLRLDFPTNQAATVLNNIAWLRGPLAITPPLSCDATDTDGDGTTDFIENNTDCRDALDPSDISFDFNNTNENFAYNQISNSEVKPEYLVLFANQNTDAFISKNNFNIDASQLTSITARVRSSVAGKYRLYWKTTTRRAYIGNFIELDYATPDQWLDLNFKVIDHPNWNTNITDLRLDFPAVSIGTGTYDLDWIKGPLAISNCLTVNVTKNNEGQSFNKAIVYPTETSNSITIKTINNLINNQGVIYDINGKLIKIIALDNTHNKIDVSLLKPGVYLLKIDDEFHRFVKK